MNVMPNLTADEYERLREDIRKRGVLDALIYDEDGRLLDGHNRLAIADELHLTDYPTQVIDLGDATEEERDQVAATLNINRRQLTPDQQRDLAAQFRINGMSVPDTARLVGASERSITSWTSRQVGEARKAKVEKARELIAGGASENAAAKAVGLPRQTLQSIAENGKSADFGSPPTPAPDATRQRSGRLTPKVKRTGPPWQRHFTTWCRSVLPEDRPYLVQMSEELHRALALLDLDCKGGIK